MDYIEDRASYSKKTKADKQTAIFVTATVPPQPIPVACCKPSGIGEMAIGKNFEVEKNDPYESMKI